MLNKEQNTDAVTLETMLIALERHIHVKLCSLRGMLTPDGDIFLVNLPIYKKPTMLQLRACVFEMERLSVLIFQKSPIVIMEVPLSALTGAEVVHKQVLSSASNDRMSVWITAAVFLNKIWHFSF